MSVNKNHQKILDFDNRVQYLKPKDVISESGYTFAELCSKLNRNRTIIYWSNILVVSLLNTKKTITDSAKYMNRNHSSTINAIKNIRDAVEGFNPELKEMLVLSLDNINVERIKSEKIVSNKYSDSSICEFKSSICLELKFNELLKNK